MDESLKVQVSAQICYLYSKHETSLLTQFSSLRALTPLSF